MDTWTYTLNGTVAACVKRGDLPYVGMPVTMIGRLGVPAKVEQFFVADFDQSNFTLKLTPNRLGVF